MWSGLNQVHAILVHGAWQGAWVWDHFAPLLCAIGCTVEAVGLPGSNGESAAVGFDEQVQALCARIEASDRPVVLIAHSGGAVVAAQAAEACHTRLTALVFVAGIMLPSGGSLSQVLAALLAEGEAAETLMGIRPHLVWSDDLVFSRVPPAIAAEIFLHDCSGEIRSFAVTRLVPQSEPARAGVPQLSSERYGRVPRIYVEALLDRSIVLKVQRKMQALSPGARVLSLDSGHVPQLSQPKALFDLLAPPLNTLLLGRL